MNQDLMLAILAMDAYNTKGNVGTAVNLNVILSPEMLAAGFSAQAYTYNGETVISFRGTDPGWAAANDIFNGWSGGAGVESTQAGLAAQFYQSVVGSAAFPFSTNVTFTGHSLGGGLAGLLAGLYGKQAVVFDNMAYSSAIANTYWDATHPTYPGTIDGNTGLPAVNESHAGVLGTFYGGGGTLAPTTSGISGYQLHGQILQGTQSTGAVVGVGVDWDVGPIDLHSQALLVLNMYAEQLTGLDPVWKDVAKYFGQELFAQGAVTGIAYSVVSEGVRPKGDAAAHSMFDDAADVANFLATEGSSYLFYNSIEPAWDLVEISVQFAKQQADTAVNVSSMGTESGGIFHATEAGLFLSLDSIAKAWDDNASISGWESIKSLTLYGLQVENQEVLSPEASSVMNEIDFALFSAGGTVDVTLDGENPMVFAGQIQNVENAAALVFGTDGVDVIKGGEGDDFLIGGGGEDTLIGGDGYDMLFGGDGADELIGGDKSDELLGGSGADTLIGGAGADTLKGGEGADIIVAGDLYGAQVQTSSDTVDGGKGTDYLVVTGAPGSSLAINGGDKQDRLLIHQSALGLVPVDENATEIPMLMLSGGVWGDVNYYREWFSDNLFGQEDDANAYRTYTYFPDAPVTAFSGFVPDLLQRINYPEAAPFTIEYKHYFNRNALEINVILQGEEQPNFTIAIADFHVGDYGIQLEPATRVVIVEYGNSGYVYTADQGLAAYTSRHTQLLDQSDDISIEVDSAINANRSAFAAINPTSNSVPNIHIAISGDVGANTLLGNDVSERLYGLDGNDVLQAAGGDDSVYGGNGNDRIVGGVGADLIDGGDGVDTADYRTSDVAVQVNLLTQCGIGGDAEGDTLVLIENIAGSQFGDLLTGDDAVNRLQGFDGNDQLFGAGGNDRLLGGLGADVIDGGNGVDTADYSTSLAAVIVNLKLNVGQGADATGDTFVAIENVSSTDFNDTLIGDDLNNRLSGVDGDDTLSGLGGIDYLVGGNGNDVMTGGAGADVFVFNVGSGRDTITDFWAGTGRTDRIQFLDGPVNSFADVVAHAVNSAAGVVIALNANDSLALSGLQLSQLRADDFLFA